MTGKQIIVHGNTYRSISEAFDHLRPPASLQMIRIWIRNGMEPDDAFTRNQYLNGRSSPIVVFGNEYKSFRNAYLALNPKSCYTLVYDWVKSGMDPDIAFAKLPDNTVGRKRKIGEFFTTGGRKPKTNSKGKPIIVNGKKYENISDAYDEIEPDVSLRTIHRQIGKGISPDLVFSGTYERSVIVFNVKYPSIFSAYEQLEPPASYDLVSRRIKAGMRPDKAFTAKPRNNDDARGLIYKITNLKNGKLYIGKTTRSIKYRWESHLKFSKLGYGKNPMSLASAIRDHGSDAFTIEMIDHGISGYNLKTKERNWILKLATLNPNGYNILLPNPNVNCSAPDMIQLLLFD